MAAHTYNLICGHDADNARLFFEIVDEAGALHPEFGRLIMANDDLINILKSAGSITALDGTHMPFEIKFAEMCAVSDSGVAAFYVGLRGGFYTKP